MRTSAFFLLCALGVLACGDDDDSSSSNNAGNAGVGGSSGSGAVGGSSGNAGSSGSGANSGGSSTGGSSGSTGGSGGGGAAGTGGSVTGGTAGMAGAGGSGGSSSCILGLSTEKTIGPDGGQISLCGATLDIPEGALAADTSFGIEIVESPVDPPVEQEFVPAVFRFTPDDSDLPFAATLTMPVDLSDGHYRQLAFYNEPELYWYTLEACPGEGTLSTQTVKLGLWSVLRDVVQYPSSNSGLGEATVDLQFMGGPMQFVVDSMGSATYEGQLTSRSVYLSLWRTNDTSFDHLDMRWGEGNGESNLLQVSYYNGASGEIWGWLEPVDGPAVDFSVTVDAEGRIQGTFEVLLNLNGASETMTGTLNVLPEKYKYPPEATCGG